MALKKKATKKKAVKEEAVAEEIIAVTETDGGIGDEVQVEELELAKDVEVDE